MSLFKNKKGSALVEKIMMAAFAVAAGAAVIVYSAGIITQSKAVSPDVANNILDGTPEAMVKTLIGENAIETTARLFGTEVNNGGEVTVTDVAMRFYGRVAKNSWDEIKTKWNISDYGLMAFKTSNLEKAQDTDSVEKAYKENKALAVVNKGSGADPELTDGIYHFALKINMTNPDNFGNVYMCCAPFVVANGEYCFFKTKSETVKSLAQYHLTNGGSDLSTAALTYLASF